MLISTAFQIAILFGVGTNALAIPNDCTRRVSVSKTSLDRSTPRLVPRRHWDDDELKECTCGFTAYSAHEFRQHVCRDPIIYDGFWYSDSDGSDSDGDSD